MRPGVPRNPDYIRTAWCHDRTEVTRKGLDVRYAVTKIAYRTPGVAL